MNWGRTVVGVGVAYGLAALTRALQARSYSFEGKSVVITGGSRGLGLVMARELVAEGARLTIIARDAEEIALAAKDLLDRGGEVLALVGDVSDEDTARDLVARAVERYGRVDVVINNAGIIKTGPIEHLTVADFDESLGVHLWGPLYTTLAAAPHMRRAGGGRIVNISSIGGLVSVPHLVPYCTAKFALVGLSDGLRAELAKDGVVVTTVCPGLMRTGSHLNALFKGRHSEEFTWFAVLDSLPLISIDARRAARQILDACRRGDPHLTISLPAQLLSLANALAPDLMAEALKLMNRLLPAPTGPEGDETKAGWESASAVAPSILTRLSDKAAVRNHGTVAIGES